MNRRRRIVVVGAGLGGLAAACHLVGRGHDVVVLERSGAPGGRAGRVESDGFSFDTGPTVLTMPDLIANTIRAAGVDPAGLLRMDRLEPAYRACFADGSTILVHSDGEAMADEIRTTCGAGDAAAYLRFRSWLDRLYRLEIPAFIDRNYDHWWQLAVPPGPGVALLRLGGLRSLQRMVDGFFRDERLRRLFSFQALYAGLSPHQARAAYAIITYMDSVAGVYAARGGVAAVPRALATAAEKAGGVIRYGVEVAGILRDGGARGRVRGVRTADGERLPADAVVVNADRPVAVRDLLTGASRRRGRHPDRHWGRRPTYSPSALVWHVGTHTRPPAGARHHNIHFGGQWREAFRALLREGRRMPDPSVLVGVPTVTEQSLAPPGGSTLYVLEPVPNLDTGRALDWPAERDAARERLATLLTRWGYLPTGTRGIATERLVDPRDWEAAGMAAGTPFALAHTFFQSGPFRPPNVDREIPGLVFTGSGTVPGVGVPMVLISGRLAAERVEELP
ncbi:MAG: phytoene desaturase family protein [Actinomycetota bacterium]